MSAIESHPGYSLQAVWPAPTARDRDDVIHFWLSEQALPEQEARARAPQLLVVARDEAGCVAGVSTAVATWVERLGLRCFYYRTFVGRAHRALGLRGSPLARDILVASFEHLNERFRRSLDPDVVGLFLDIENPAVTRVYDQAVWREGEIRFVYIGQTPDSHHLRIAYFDDARIGRKQAESVILRTVQGMALATP